MNIESPSETKKSYVSLQSLESITVRLNVSEHKFEIIVSD